eukprot:2161778-Pleurochrysis_carterae.AAC.2
MPEPATSWLYATARWQHRKKSMGAAAGGVHLVREDSGVVHDEVAGPIAVGLVTEAEVVLVLRRVVMHARQIRSRHRAERRGQHGLMDTRFQAQRDTLARPAWMQANSRETAWPL